MRRHIVELASLKKGNLFLKALVESLLRWRNVARNRRHLLELNDWMLRDIGLTRYEAQHGAAFHSDAAREPK